MLPHIIVDQRIAQLCPDLAIGMIRARVKNSPTSDALWKRISEVETQIRAQYQLDQINKRPAIVATRKLYRGLGKDPGRYRVASEALCRRIVKGDGMYRLTTLVDLVNLVSVLSGYPISGLDAGAIVGHSLRLDVGRSDDVFQGIGRGLLNIEGLPVYRDDQGPIASPTSDEERTKFTLETNIAQININAFGPELPLPQAMEMTVDLLRDFAEATDIETNIVTDFT